MRVPCRHDWRLFQITRVSYGSLESSSMEETTLRVTEQCSRCWRYRCSRTFGVLGPVSEKGQQQ